MDRSPTGPSVPLPSAVPGNQWTDLEVPAIGRWRPRRTVTVVVPFYERQAELDRTLAGLTQQTYPLDLVDVVIADDGSARTPVIPPIARSLNVAVHTQQHRGYGLARARNLGARVARGEVLVFLDGDMIPERQQIEAHVRWHDAASDVVTIGSRWHANFVAFSAEEIADAVQADALESLVASQDVDRPEWMQRFLEQSGGLTAPRDDLYRVMSGGNLGIRRDLYLDAGGSNEDFDRYGAEDRELGFRLLQLGAVVVPEAAAVCWHQGGGSRSSTAELDAFRLQRPVVDNLIAEASYRDPKPGRSYTVPFAVVTVDARDSRAEGAARTVESILGSSFHDLVVVLRAPADADDAEWLRREFRSDQRVIVTDDVLLGERRFRFSPLRIQVPASVLFHRQTIEAILGHKGSEGVGAMYLNLPAEAATQEAVTVVTTRAVERARRVAADPADIAPMIDRLFGALRDDGAAFGLGLHDGSPAEPPVVSPIRPVRGKLDGTVAQADFDRIAAMLVRTESNEERMRSALERAEGQREAFRRRRAIRVADALGQLGSARSAGELRAGLDALQRSLRRPSR